MKRQWLNGVLLLGIVVIVGSCIEIGNEREDCTGQIFVENEIPDVTLYVGVEAFSRDISEPPVIFSHTEKEITSIEVIALDNDIVLAGTRINEDSKRYILHVGARKEGSTEIRVSAKDGCDGYTVSTTFTVTVIDTTAN
ncbi:MAG: hypothetical protein AAFW89_04420 [Bacteroidota bacterium]